MESPRKNADELPQRTWLHHTAAVVDDEFNIVSQSRTMVGTVRMPDSLVPAFAIRYNMAGSIAERIDRRGVAFRYRYDGDERLASIEVGHYPPPTTDSLDYPPANATFTPGYPASMSAATGAVADRVGFVEYGYNFAGRLERVTTWTGVAGAIIAQNVFGNDLRGHMIREWQQIGGGATFDTPRIDYWWDYQPTTLTTEGEVVNPGRDRLSGMTYPRHRQVTTALAYKRRQVDVEYGTPGSTEDLTSRITDIDTFLPNSAPTSVADIARTGSGRRASMGLANSRILATFAAAGVIGLPGLDTFGRVADLHYSGAGGGVLHRAVYTHDAAGNRLTARVTQAAAPGIGNGDNKRSQAHGYDQLNRLVESQVGVLDEYGVIGTADRIRTDQWHLDLLGNWIGTDMDPQSPPPTTLAGLYGRRSTGNLDGYGTPWLAAGGAAGVDAQPETRHFTPFTDHGNQLAEFLSWRDDGGESPSPDPIPAPARTHTLRDAAGNLVFDGTYVYQYDAWNRVVQVNKGSLAWDPSVEPPPPGPFPFNHPPQSETKAGFTLGWMAEPILLMGPLVRQYSYDGLGRLVRSVSPYPTPETTTGEVWSERYYHDGVRRIQEVVLDPILNIEEGKESGDPLVEQEAEEASAGGVDESGATTELEKAQEEGGGGDGTARALIDREYIWGPGDGSGGVDELLVQFDATRHSETGAWWVLQDGGGDSVALCDLRGESGKARVVAQWVYDAYGSVLSADHLWPHALLRVGHKGLFLDRLDVGVAGFADSAPIGGQPGTGASLDEPPRLVPFAQGFYHVRNRVYVPQFGRWLQRDPNASGLAVMDSLAFHGGTQAAAAMVVDMEGMYSDGLSLYQYLVGNPWSRSDPKGLYTLEDGFEDVTDALGLLDPIPGPSDFIRETLKALVEDYSANLDFDSEWAADWTLGDQDHTRNDNEWVILAIARGLQAAFDIDLPGTDESFNPFVSFASNTGGRSGGGLNKGPKLSRFGGMTQRVTWKSPTSGREFKATRYYTKNNGSSRKPFVYVHQDSRLDQADVPKMASNAAERQEANRMKSKPANYDWSTEYGFPCTWHHDHKHSGRLYLVPRELHEGTKVHIGRAAH